MGRVTITRAVAAVRRVPVTAAFVVLLTAGEIAYSLLARPDAQRLVAWASTNVTRLRSEPLGPMLASAVVVQEDPLAWLVIGGAAIAIVEWRLGWWRVLVAALAAHVLGTLVSEGIVAWRVHAGSLPTSALHQDDVGVSYVVVGALAAVVAVAPRLVQLAALGLLLVLAPALLDGITSLGVAAVGHLTSAVVGFAAAGLLRANARRKAPELAGRAA